MATLSYDLVVLGGDFAGLVAATLCASRGMRVLVAETSKRSDTYRLDGEQMPAAPLVITGTEDSALERVIQELHFQHLLKRRLEVLDPPCQLLSQNVRLEAHSDRLRFSRGVQRELGSDEDWLLAADRAQEAFGSLLQADSCMPPTGFWERRELGKFVSNYQSASEAWFDTAHSTESEALSDIALNAIAGTTEGSAFSRARAFAISRRGITGVKGDWESWRSLFEDKFKSHNGEFRRLQPQSLHVGWGKVTGLSSLDDEISCEHLIAAMPAHELVPLFSKKAPKRLVELAEAATPLAFRYTLNLIVHMSGIPEGMGKLAWSQLDPQVLGTGGGFASFNIRPAAQAGRAIVSMQGLAPASDEGTPELEGMREAMLAHAHQLMPFLGAHLDSIDSPHEPVDAGHTRDLPELVAPTPVWDCPTDETLQLPAMPYAVGLKHLTMASAQTLPSLGLEGQFIAGWSAAKLASSNTSKRKPSGKQPLLAESHS